MPLINSSVLYSYIGNQAKAEENLMKVIAIDPVNEAANLNLGFLMAGQGSSICRSSSGSCTRRTKICLHPGVLPKPEQ